MEPSESNQQAECQNGSPTPALFQSALQSSLQIASLLVVVILASFSTGPLLRKNSPNSNHAISHQARIDLNSASLPELMLIPGIGRKTAHDIVEARFQSNGFRSLRDVAQIRGVGEKTIAAIERYSFVAPTEKRPSLSEGYLADSSQQEQKGKE